MKDEDIDDVLAIALANLKDPNLPEFLKKAAAEAPRAPLAVLIDAFLSEQPGIAVRPRLEAIAALNQGTPEDLDRPACQSYLIGRLGMVEAELGRCMRAVGNYRRLSQATVGERFLTAARDEARDGGGSVDAAEIREQLKKRNK
jgi:hypothetical protein